MMSSPECHNEVGGGGFGLAVFDMVAGQAYSLQGLTSTAARAKLRRRAKRPPQFGVGLAGSLGDVLQLVNKIPAGCGWRKLFSVVFIELYDLSDNVAEFFEDGHLVVAVASA
jgi:hypothetical protein